jgi:hypothetical protein
MVKVVGAPGRGPDTMLEELQSIADSLADRLSRSVALDDPQIRLLMHAAHHA